MLHGATSQEFSGFLVQISLSHVTKLHCVNWPLRYFILAVQRPPFVTLFPLDLICRPSENQAGYVSGGFRNNSENKIELDNHPLLSWNVFSVG